jgi:hypothetical protein
MPYVEAAERIDSTSPLGYACLPSQMSFFMSETDSQGFSLLIDVVMRWEGEN